MLDAKRKVETGKCASCGACDLGSQIRNITGITKRTHPHQHQVEKHQTD
jgi:hypothetical protein